MLKEMHDGALLSIRRSISSSMRILGSPLRSSPQSFIGRRCNRKKNTVVHTKEVRNEELEELRKNFAEFKELYGEVSGAKTSFGKYKTKLTKKIEKASREIKAEGLRNLKDTFQDTMIRHELDKLKKYSKQESLTYALDNIFV
eukprot:TRINITY_DN2314_c0_g1_i1.p1 TRINITY_DN2314_c0_g1~~TRINITY_DN2314_c0_g1_i1.p1  ORF type:complete len:143 (+),score=27.22 TRINITY_DN2314_c0_g1_i1:70-498(+)